MISIVIPFYKSIDKLYKLLESIREADQRGGLEIEVIVVDDYSPQDFLTGVKKDFGFVKWIRLPKKSGPASARNRGAKAASGDILLFLDSDVIIKKDTLLKIKRAFDKGGVIVLEGEYDVIPANPGFFPRYKALEYRSFVGNQKYLTVFGPRICAIKREIFLKFEGFDSSYTVASVEDYEFSHRLLDRGYRIHYDKTLEVKHHFTESLIKQFSLSFNRTKSWAKLFARRKKFDNFGTTFSEGLGRFSGFLFVISLVTIFISGYFLIASILLFFIYLLLNGKFFRLVFREEGFLFLIKSIVSHLLISVFINMGFIYGMLTAKSRK